MLDDPTLHAVHAGFQAGFRSGQSGIIWVKRFNQDGLAGLEDQPKAGRHPTHYQTVRSELLNLALQKPNTLGYPFKLWTLERLQTAFQERHGVNLSDSTIWEWVEAEGFEWKRQQSWLHDAEKHIPQFVEKKGASWWPTSHPPRTRVICLDKLGPMAVKTYPGEEWHRDEHRATFEPDYGIRGKLWVHGAFEPATGQATILVSPGRDSASHIRLLEQVMIEFPEDRWLFIEDNQVIHTSQERTELRKLEAIDPGSLCGTCILERSSPYEATHWKAEKNI